MQSRTLPKWNLKNILFRSLNELNRCRSDCCLTAVSLKGGRTRIRAPGTLNFRLGVFYIKLTEEVEKRIDNSFCLVIGFDSIRD